MLKRTIDILIDSIVVIVVVLVTANVTAEYLHSYDIKDANTQVESLTRSIEDMISINEYKDHKISDLLIIQSIMNDGATLIQAKDIVSASNEKNIDPLLVSKLIKSENDFSRKKHSLKGVIGICGININVHKDLPYNVYTDSGNINACVHILDTYLKNSNYDTLKAITKYKSNTKAGYLLALEVMNDYENN